MPPFACQLHPNLSWTGRTHAPTGQGPCPVLEFPPRAGGAKRTVSVNLTDVPRDLGVAVNTIKAWLPVLEATYQVIVLRPYFANVVKRLAKTPKVYFADVGTLCYLTGRKDPAHGASGPMGGAILETAVLSEIVKTLTHRGIDPAGLLLADTGRNGGGLRGQGCRRAGCHWGQAVRYATTDHGCRH